MNVSLLINLEHHTVLFSARNLSEYMKSDSAEHLRHDDKMKLDSRADR